MNIKDVLDQIGQDVLTEETKKLLTDAFADAVITASGEKVTLEVESALKKLDEEHAGKLEKLLEAIDTDHTKKLQSVIEKIDADHTEKLKYLIEKHEAEIREDAGKFKNELVTQLSNYLDVYVGTAIPEKELKEAVQNKRAQKIVNQVKQLISLDEQYINDTVREAVSDGKKTIDSLKSELTEAIKANIQINQAYKTTNAELVLEKATARFAKDKRDFVLRALKDKDPEYITENLNYVIKMFEKDEEERRDVLTENATKSSTIVKDKVDVPQSKIKDTSLMTESTVPGETVVDYLAAMQNQDRFKK